MASKRSTFAHFKKQALKDVEVKAEYDALSTTYEMKRQMIAIRKEAGVTQEQMAERLGTKKSSISRLESLSAPSSPSLSTIEDYARALGYSVRVEFRPAV
ncbi:MAG: helix-turn-helix domain-containing protein [Halioglobus sp.]